MENKAFNLCMKDAYLQKRETSRDAYTLLVCLFTLKALEGRDGLYSLFAQN